MVLLLLQHHRFHLSIIQYLYYKYKLQKVFHLHMYLNLKAHAKWRSVQPFDKTNLHMLDHHLSLDLIYLNSLPYHQNTQTHRDRLRSIHHNRRENLIQFLLCHLLMNKYCWLQKMLHKINTANDNLEKLCCYLLQVFRFHLKNFVHLWKSVNL